MASIEERISKEAYKIVFSKIWEQKDIISNGLSKSLVRPGWGEKDEYGKQSFTDESGNIVTHNEGFFSSNMADIWASTDKLEFSYYADGVIRGPLLRIEKDNEVGCKVIFPDIYNPKKSKILGLDDVTDKDNQPLTIMQMLEGRIDRDPSLSKYKDIILGDFNNILSLVPELKIEPISETEMALVQALKSNTLLEKENNDLKKENSEKDKLIERLQTMLSKALNLLEKVKKHPIGKLFFGKDIANSAIINPGLEEGREEKSN